MRIYRVILNESTYLQIFSYYMHIYRVILNEPTYLQNFSYYIACIQCDS